MGIQGLESFLLHKHRPACPTISIPETAAKYRSETGRVPVALVDGSALPYYVSGSLNQRSGGQFKELKEKVVAFAERLRSTGVTPVFFFKGAPNVGQLAVWEQRRRQHLDRVAKEFESLETNANRKHKTTKQPMEPAHAEAGVSQAASDIQGSHNAPAVDAELAAADGDVTNSQETAAEQALYAPIKDDAELALSATTVDTGTRLILDGVQEQAIVVQDDVKESPVIVEPFVAAPHEGVHKMALEGSAMTTVATSTVTEDRIVVDTSTYTNEDKTEQEDIILATSSIPEQEDIILATSTIPEQEDIILATSTITELEDTEETDIILSTPTITEEIDIILGTPTITEETDVIPATPKVREELFFGMLREESEIYLATPRLRDDTVIPATPRLRDDTVIPATPSLTAGEKADLESPLLNQHDVLDVERTRSSNAEGVATEPVLAANDRVDVPLIVIEDDVVERMTEAVDSVLVGESSLDVEVLNGEIAVEPACAAHHENDLKKTQKCVDRKVNTPVHPAQEKIVEPLIVTIDDDVEPSVAAQGYVGAGRVSLSCDSATVASPALADDPPIVNQPALSHQFKSVVLDPTRPVWRPFPRLNTEMDSAVSPLPGEGDVVSSHPDMTREPSPAVQPYFDDNSYIVESFHGYNRPKSWSNGSNVSEHGSGDSGGRGKGRRGGRVERDYRGRDDDHQGRDGGRRGRDGGHRGRDGGRRGRDGSRQDRDGSRQDRDGSHQGRDGSHQGRDGSHQGRDGSHQGRDGSRRGRGGVHRSDDGNIIGAFDGGRGVGRHGGFGGGYEGGFDGGPGVAFYGGFPSALPGVLPGALPGALPGGFEGFGQGFFTGVNGSHLGLGSLVGSSGDYHCGGVDGERHRSLDRRQQHNSTAPTGMAGSTGVTGQWGARKHRPKQSRRLQPTVLPEGAYECAKLALQEAGFQVIVSEEEADVEMARYARENDCFCILTTDSDFVAMDGARYLLSLSHLEEESMTTVSFNRRALARRLEIPCHQLPMLFSLFPNNCVPSSYLHPLHHRLTGGAYDKLNIEHSFHFEEVFPKLLNLVRNELNRKSAQDAVAAIIIKALASYPAERLNRYAQQLNFRDRWGLREALTQQLEASLRSHDYTPPRPFSPLPPAPDAPARALDSRVLAVARARHTSLAFLTPSVLTVLDKGIMEQALGLEDPRVPLGSESALRPFRRRLYGLLLGKDGPAVVREFILPNRVPDDAKLQPVDAQVVVPDPELLPARGLLALWGIPDVDDESSTEKRDAGVDSAVGTQEATDAVCDIKCSEGTSGDAVQEAEVTLGVENPEVVEEMKSTHDEDVEILEEAAVVTSIAARVSVEDPAALNEARWRLLAWCLCPAMSSGIVEGEGLANRLRAIPLGLVLPTAALFLVHHSGALGAALGAAKEAARLAAQAAADVEDAAAASSSASVCSSESPAPSTPTADDAAPQLTYEAAGAAAAAAAGAPTVVEAATSRGSRGRREVPLPETSEELVRLVARACIITGKLSAAKICKLTYQGPHRLAVHVAAIFMKAWHNLAVLNDALGALIPLQLMNPADVFDGKVFQRTFSRMGLPADCDEPLLEAMVGAACLGGDEACALCCADRTGASNEAAVE